MIAVDTNILVYAHRGDSSFHPVAARQLRRLTEGRRQWAIPWPCVHEFLAVVTNKKIYHPTTSLEQAITQIDAWLESPNLEMLGETEGYWNKLKAAILKGNVNGAMVHDARIVAICIQHGVEVLWTADKDFARFAGLKVRNPLLED